MGFNQSGCVQGFFYTIKMYAFGELTLQLDATITIHPLHFFQENSLSSISPLLFINCAKSDFLENNAFGFCTTLYTHQNSFQHSDTKSSQYMYMGYVVTRRYQKLHTQLLFGQSSNTPALPGILIFKKTNSLERVQRKAARFCTNGYHPTASVTDMIRELGWQTLEQRRSFL